jgi:hypothetical protein
VAATLVATGAAAMASRGLGVALGVPSVLLTIGVVYCQMHYAVDALAGVVVAGLVLAAVLVKEKGARGSGLGGQPSSLVPSPQPPGPATEP